MVSDYEDDEDMEYDDDPDYDGPMDGTSVLYSELLLLCRVAFTVTVSPSMSWIHGKCLLSVVRTCVRFTVVYVQMEGFRRVRTRFLRTSGGFRVRTQVLWARFFAVQLSLRNFICVLS
jgi:hypothetical protein